MAVSLSSLGGAAAQFSDNNGVPLSGGKIYTYAAGTTTPLATYTSYSGSTPHANPIVLDSAGRVPSGEIWLTDDASYKFVIYTSTDILVGTYDNITGIFPASVITSNNIQYTPDGTGAYNTTVQAQLRQFTVPLKNYYNGTLSPGADITTALQNAINAASARVSSNGGQAIVTIPAGYYYNITATITIPSGVIVEGDGAVQTYIRRIGSDFNSFQVGTPNPAANVQCAGIRNLCIFHDHGGGTVPPLNPLDWQNPTIGAIAHIVAYTPVKCVFENLNLYSMPLGVVIQGGSFTVVRNVDTYQTWDDDYAVMQEGLAGLLIDQNSSVTGSIPTWHLIEFCRFGGQTRPNTLVTYYGGHTKTTTKNIGPQNGLTIFAGEAIYVDNCYTDACNSNGILLSSLSTQILAGVTISNHFFDPCGIKYQDACVKFENRDATGIISGVVITGANFKGQTNGWRAVSDWGSTSLAGSVTDFYMDGTINAFVANPLEIYNVRRAQINCTIAGYNCEGWYSADEACAVHVNQLSSNVYVTGILGGGVFGEVSGPSVHTIDGVRADDWVASRVYVNASNGGLLGTLFVGPPPLASFSTETSSFILTPKGSSWNILHTATLTSDINATLSVTNAEDGDVFTITRTGSGAFNLNVVGVTTVALATNTWCSFIYVTGTGWVIQTKGSL